MFNLFLRMCFMFCNCCIGHIITEEIKIHNNNMMLALDRSNAWEKQKIFQASNVISVPTHEYALSDYTFVQSLFSASIRLLTF